MWAGWGFRGEVWLAEGGRCWDARGHPGVRDRGCRSRGSGRAAAASPASPSPGLRVYSRTNQSDMMVVAD